MLKDTKTLARTLALIAAASLVSCKHSAPAAEGGAPVDAAQSKPGPVLSEDAQKRMRLPPPDRLPMSVRRVIATKMRNHGDDMTLLLWAMLFLDFDSAGELADAIATEPKLARPSKINPDEVNEMLPPRFFKMQDELQKRAKELVDLSEVVVREPDAFAEAYGRLATACVSCHASYLYEDGKSGAASKPSKNP